ncbi:MAG: DUF131 domain-containing protein [Candidatus Bathyarchaeia archaeon]
MSDPLLTVGFLAVVVGIALMVLGALLSALRAGHRKERERGKMAGVVLIGPFPIIIGDRGLVKYSLILLLVFAALSLALLLSSLRLTQP